MPIELTLSGKTYQQNEKIVLSNGDFFKSTKSLQNKPGRWYYEITHYSGINYHLPGFSCEGGRFNFYLGGSLSRPHFFLDDTFRTEQSIYMSFELQREHTIGLGIDTYKHIFYVYYDKYYDYYILNSTASLRKLNAIVRGAYSNYTNDEVSVNFGAFSFKYNISGFTPWEYNQEEKTCYHKINKRVNALLNLIIVLLY